MEKFSVLISVYAKEKASYLSECLESLAKQTLPAAEIILVQDGPISSELEQVIESYRHALAIKTVALTENVGLALALNQGLSKCSNDLIARMDSDDVAVENRFEKQIKFMSKHPQISASSGTVEEFDESGNQFSIRRLPTNHQELMEFAKTRNPLNHPATIFRRKHVLSIGGYQNIYPEDHLLWVCLIQNGYQIANLTDTLVKMRVTADFINRRGFKFLKGEVRLLRYMHQTKFINTNVFLKMLLVRCALRLSPSFVKRLLYKFAR